MSYKIVRRDEATFYEAPGHYDMRPTRLHNPQDVNDGRIIMGLSRFLPGGGCEFGSNPLESIYYILEGEMDLETEDGSKRTLHKGDSFHCGPGTKKGIQNNGCTTCQMLVCLVPPKQKTEKEC